MSGAKWQPKRGEENLTACCGRSICMLSEATARPIYISKEGTCTLVWVMSESGRSKRCSIWWTRTRTGNLNLMWLPHDAVYLLLWPLQGSGIPHLLDSSWGFLSWVSQIPDVNASAENNVKMTPRCLIGFVSSKFMRGWRLVLAVSNICIQLLHTLTLTRYNSWKFNKTMEKHPLSILYRKSMGSWSMSMLPKATPRLVYIFSVETTSRLDPAQQTEEVLEEAWKQAQLVEPLATWSVN